MDLMNYNPDREIWTPPGGPPQTDRIPAAVYEAMGEENIFAFTRAFYLRLAASSVAHLFPRGERNLMAAADKSAALNVFLMGGPHLYQQRHGPPRLRMRHIPFVIDEAGRREWMRCFRETLAEAPEQYGMPAEHVAAVEKFYDDFSGWMVNSKGEETGGEETERRRDAETE
ncbi:MAG: hypothetical protein LAT64_06970 [Phycisphaerales bacterium]|nr:hypothetical protein [Planctomycetota bacterium]MCH8508496.1 hypothetical protein [Phycisphaerales bacterium]